MKENIEKKIIKHTAIYSLSVYASYFLIIIRGFIIAKFLGPVMFGLWEAVKIIREYGGYLDIGTFAALDREIPYYAGKKSKRKLEKLQNVSFFFNIIVSILFGAVIIGGSFFYSGSNLLTLNAVRLMSVAVILQQIYYFYLILYKAHKKVVEASKIQFIFTFVNTLLSLGLLYFFNIYGLLAGLILAHVVILIISVKLNSQKLKLEWDLKELVSQIKLGAPIKFSTFMTLIFRTIDRLMILFYLNQEKLGFYGISIFVNSFFYFIPTSIGTVTYPRLMEKYGKTGDIHKVKDYAIKPTLILSFGLAFLIGLFYLSIHIPIQYVLSKFLPGLSSTKILAFGMFFMSLIPIAHHVVVALKKQMTYNLFILITAILSIILNLIFISMGFDIAGVALGTTISFMVFSLVVLSFVSKFMFYTIKEKIKFLIFCYAPIAYTAIWVIILEKFWPPIISADYFANISITILKLTIFTAIYLPLILFINKKYNIFIKIFEIVVESKIINRNAKKN